MSYHFIIAIAFLGRTLQVSTYFKVKSVTATLLVC